MTQPNLFGRQPSCRIIAFPVRARVGCIRQAAQSITKSRSDREAEHRWKQAIGSVRKSLMMAGVSDHDMQRHLADFLIAVDTELLLIRSPWRLRTPADAGTGGVA